MPPEWVRVGEPRGIWNRNIGGGVGVGWSGHPLGEKKKNNRREELGDGRTADPISCGSTLGCTLGGWVTGKRVTL